MNGSSNTRQYYSVRTAKNPADAQLTFELLKTMFQSVYSQLSGKDYFHEAFGFYCVDAEDVPGTVGSDVANYVLFRTRKQLWPIPDHIDELGESDLFDLIEFLFDHVSKPLEGSFHSHMGCGMHWETFDKEAGRTEYCSMLNPLLASYGPGFELNNRGEIMQTGPRELGNLLRADPPSEDGTVRSRIRAAVDCFQRYGSSIEDRRHAVRDLADVLEKLRPRAKTVLRSKDEDDLFNLANNFGIRHLNDRQKSDYDPAVWLSWMFYHYLATIFAVLHLLERKPKGERKP
ncbi:hypothetical protein [Tsuneonella aeria]|uniref:hypothetical protein n=1 Tax=Tsuneonella aeria TaxID=1837929 RepID=UPI001928AC7D|nr:hypothetical protein [Tsuneonella aeria]